MNTPNTQQPSDLPDARWIAEKILSYTQPETPAHHEAAMRCARVILTRIEKAIAQRPSTESSERDAALEEAMVVVSGIGAFENGDNDTIVKCIRALIEVKGKSQPAPVSTENELSSAEIRMIMHNYSRMHQPGHYSDTEFDCLQDVIAFVRECITTSKRAGAASVEAHADAVGRITFDNETGLALNFNQVGGRWKITLPTAPLPDQAAGEMTPGSIQGAQLNAYPAGDQAFFSFWYSHMQGDTMTGALADIKHSTARYIWDSARATAPVAAGWVSVEDRLPPDEMPVVILLSGEVAIGELRWDHPGYEETYKSFRYWDDPRNDGQCWEWHSITHWCDLPVHPTESLKGDA